MRNNQALAERETSDDVTVQFSMDVAQCVGERDVSHWLVLGIKSAFLETPSAYLKFIRSIQ